MALRIYLIASLLAALSGDASSYTIKASSTGAHLKWADGDVVFTPDPMVDTGVTQTSLGTWQAVFAPDTVTLSLAAPVAAAPHAGDGVNTVRWATASDDPDIEPGVLANTYLAYRAADGAIQDADVVLNAVDFHWATTLADCGNEYDVQSALTHELGHALGLAHSLGHPEATMFATGDACEIGKRDLDPDDTAAIAELYPTPTTGGGGCDASGGRGGLWIAALSIALLCGRRRAAIAFGVLAAIAGRADAAQLAELDLATLGDQAAMVIRGHVVASAVTPDGPIETISMVVVDDCLVGNCPSSVQVVRRGGERDGTGLWVDAEARLEVGTDAVLYLRVDPRGRLRVLGGVQGALEVVRIGGALYVVRDLRGHELRVDRVWRDGEREVHELGQLRRRLAARRQP